MFPSTTAVLAKAMLKWPFCFCYGLNACVPHNSQVEVLRMVLGVGLWAVLRSWAASGMRLVTVRSTREMVPCPPCEDTYIQVTANQEPVFAGARASCHLIPDQPPERRKECLLCILLQQPKPGFPNSAGTALLCLFSLFAAPLPPQPLETPHVRGLGGPMGSRCPCPWLLPLGNRHEFLAFQPSSGVAFLGDLDALHTSLGIPFLLAPGLY